MKLLSLSAVAAGATALSVLAGETDAAYSCTPFKVLMTRAVGTKAKMVTDSSTGKTVFSPEFELNNVDLASISGSLKFVITETIDYDSGIDKVNCQRKNNVNYIDFYVFTVCNPANSTWWYSPLKEVGYGGTPGYDNHGFGEYLTFDGGLCNPDQPSCARLFGNSSVPKLGQFVGWKDVSTDDRNPTENAYWFSAPGSCPLRPWTAGFGGISTAKDNACIAQYPSGRCAPGTTPDGVKCTYQYEFYGEVDISYMSGIKDLGYSTYNEFCKAGNKEFVRDPGTFEFVSGLSFWNNTKNQTANAARIVKMLEHYGNSSLYPNNKALPSAASINSANPPCYCVSPACTSSSPCKWNSENVCVSCTAGSSGCSSTTDYSKCKGDPTTIPKVALPPGASSGGGSGSSNSDGSSGSKSGASTYAVSAGLVAINAAVALFMRN